MALSANVNIPSGDIPTMRHCFSLHAGHELLPRAVGEQLPPFSQKYSPPRFKLRR